MKISVVTAAYNARDTIQNTIQSVLSQSYPDVEHVIVDGRSDDGTAELARRLAPKAIIISERDSGIYDAMNKGVQTATGDVIALLNADDRYRDSAVLSGIVQRFNADPTLEGIFADTAFFNPGRPDRITRRYRSSDFKPSRLQFGIMPAHPGTFLRKEVYTRTGPFDTRFRIAADFEFFARLFTNGGLEYCYLDEVAVLMQAGGASTRNWRSKWVIYQECLRACELNGIRTSPARMLVKYLLKAPQFLKPSA